MNTIYNFDKVSDEDLLALADLLNDLASSYIPDAIVCNTPELTMLRDLGDQLLSHVCAELLNRELIDPCELSEIDYSTYEFVPDRCKKCKSSDLMDGVCRSCGAFYHIHPDMTVSWHAPGSRLNA
jgi:hypothetical protein